MKTLATAITAIALIGTPAFAADMAVKAPPPAPAPIYSWTGWYVGGNVGASFGRAKTDFNVAPVTAEVSGSNGGFSGTTTLGISGFSGSDTEYPSGFMGGGQIGYNWQLSPVWVAGLEADIQGALERDSSTLTSNFIELFNSNPVLGHVTGSTALDYETKIQWFGTARVRVGYLWGNGNVFSYVTGGLAYGEVKTDGTSIVSGSISAIPAVPFSITHAIGHSQVNTGWTVGYGTEGKLLIPGWTLKAEYLYVDLGTLDATGSGGSASAGIPFSFVAVSGGQVTTHTHFTDNILRVGLNYQFH
jgi:outer membrane immunogenic protein